MLARNRNALVVSVALLGVLSIAVWFWLSPLRDADAARRGSLEPPAPESSNEAEAPRSEDDAASRRATPANTQTSTPAMSTPPETPVARVLIVGHVVDTAARAIEGVEVRFDAYPEAAQPTATASDGSFTLACGAERKPGDHALLVSSRRHAAQIVVLATRSIARTADPEGRESRFDVGEIVLQPGGGIVGRVVRPDRTPVADVTIRRDTLDVPYARLDARRRSFTRMLGEPWPMATSAADGSFELLGVPEGKTRLVATKAGFLATFSELIELRAGVDASDVLLVLDLLEREDFVTGVVLASDGQPLAGVTVSAFRERDSFARVTSDTAGRFSIPLEARDPCGLLVAESAGLGSFAWSDAVHPGDDVVLRTQPWREVRVKASAVDAAALEGLQVSVRDARLGVTYAFDASDPSSVRIPPAVLNASASARGYRTARLPSIDGASVTELAFVFEREPQHEASVEEPQPEEPKVETPSVLEIDLHGEITLDGAPPEGAWTVDLGYVETRDAKGPLARTQLDRDGRFTWQRPTSGKQRVQVLVVGGALDGTLYRDEIDVSAATTSWRRDLRSARVQVEFAGAPKKLVALWLGEGSSFAARPNVAAGEFTTLAGTIRLIDAATKLTQSSPREFPYLVEGEAKAGETLVLRVP